MTRHLDQKVDDELLEHLQHVGLGGDVVHQVPGLDGKKMGKKLLVKFFIFSFNSFSYQDSLKTRTMPISRTAAVPYSCRVLATLEALAFVADKRRFKAL